MVFVSFDQKSGCLDGAPPVGGHGGDPEINQHSEDPLALVVGATRVRAIAAGDKSGLSDQWGFSRQLPSRSWELTG